VIPPDTEEDCVYEIKARRQQTMKIAMKIMGSICRLHL